jgi:hypothetical protein
MSLTKPQKYGTIYISTPRRIMPLFKVQREYTNWEEITVEAESKELALEVMEEDESLWDYAYDVNTYNYTGETYIEETDE